MKQIFRLCGYLAIVLLITQNVFAKAPWGILTETVGDTSFSVYAIDNLIDARPIRYAFSDEDAEKEDIFKQNIQSWPQETLRFIEEEKRTEEFEDIIPYLRRNLDLQKVSDKNEADVYVDISDTNWEDINYFKEKGKTPYSLIYITTQAKNASFRSTSLHEIGHYFGLGDQYVTARGNSHLEYSSDVNTVYGSIMDNADHITCDDADGFINLLDLRLAQRNGGNFSARSQTGWKSLCSNASNTYQDAKTITRNPVDKVLEERLTMQMLTIREYKQGKIFRNTQIGLYTPLDVFLVLENDSHVVRDPQTHLISSITENVTQTVYTPQGEPLEQEVVLVRLFTYGPRRQNEQGVPIIPLQVSGTINGVEVYRMDLTLAAKGTLVSGLNKTSFSDKIYLSQGADLNARQLQVRFSFPSGFSEFSQTSYMVFFSGGSLRGARKDVFVTFTDSQSGETVNYNLPLLKQSSDEIYVYYALARLHESALNSFYKNFYVPLFSAKFPKKL